MLIKPATWFFLRAHVLKFQFDRRVRFVDQQGFYVKITTVPGETQVSTYLQQHVIMINFPISKRDHDKLAYDIFGVFRNSSSTYSK